MEQLQESLELFTAPIYVMETSDVNATLPKRAIVKIPLINFGSNKKNLVWIPETMRKIAHMFRGVPFRYDLTGTNEGSHTKDRMSSPFYDVGWTYSDERGAYYDPEKMCVWVEGEVTHPEVIEKLMRTTTEGKREINYASMGAMLKPEDTKCSICGKSPFGSCKHTRGEVYNGDVCGMVPTNITKALHVALTNDPADRVAEIAQAIFQDMTNQIDNSRKDSPVSVAPNLPGSDINISEIRDILKQLVIEMLDKQKKTELSDDSEEEKKMDKDKKKKDLPVDDGEEKEIEGSKKDKIEDKKEYGKADPTKAEEDDKKKEKKETSDDVKEKKEEKVEKKVEKGNSENVKEEGKEDDEEDKKKKKIVADDSSEENMAPINEVSGYSFKIRSPAMGAKPVVETQDNVPVQKIIPPVVDYASKYKAKIMSELADAYVKYNKAKNKNEAITILQDKSIEQLEIYQDAFDGLVIPERPKEQEKPVSTSKPVLQDNNQKSMNTNVFADAVPEFGGTGIDADPYVEVSDMTANERRQKFGEFGAFDVCFNPQNTNRYINEE